LHIQNARFAGSYEWHGTVTLRINAQRCKMGQTAKGGLPFN